MANKGINILAKKIVKLEKIIQDSENQEEKDLAQEKIQEIMKNLTMWDMLELDEAIQKIFSKNK